LLFFASCLSIKFTVIFYKKMNRKEFLAQLGVGAAAVVLTTCLGSCGKTSLVDFTLDLTATANDALKTAGGYVINNGVVVAKNAAGAYIAATLTCSHEQENKIKFKNDQWFCTAHSAVFSQSGAGVSGPSGGGLMVYKTALTGNSLRVYSS
jgi:nitrite reductase/ring-hydroxylating ferredoxin subunit